MENSQAVVPAEPQVETPITPQEPQTPEQPTPSLSEKQVEEIQKKAFGHGLSLIDNALEELGYKKPEGVKTTDHLKTLLSKKDEPSGTKTDGDSVDTKDNDAKIKALQDALKEKEVELEGVKASVSKAKRDYWVDSLVSGTKINIPEHLSETEKSRMKLRTQGLIKSELSTNYDIRESDGEFKFYTKDGQPIWDGTAEMNPISPQALIEREFSEYLKAPEAPKQVTGTGKNQEGKETTPHVVPSGIKTKAEYYAYLRNEKGFTLGSAEFMEQVTKAQEERPAMFR